MDAGTELIDALNQIEREKGINKEVIFEAIESSLVTACKKNFGSSQNVKVIIDRTTGAINVFVQKTAVEQVNDETLEINLDKAREISSKSMPGDIVDIIVTPRDFGRISAQTAKQVVVQKIREAEREIVYDDFKSKEREIVTGVVQRRDKRNLIVTLGKLDCLLIPSEQIPNERYVQHDRIKVYIVEVRQTTKGPQVTVSRSHPELVKRLFEQEVPEVYDGTVEIKAISREAGSRTKIAVYSRNPDVDAVGACVGQNGNRVNVIVNELRGEKIDIICWVDDARQYIASALSPSNVLAVALDTESRIARVVVPDNQLSLAIGKEGQNAKLAARLTGWKIDIKNETQAMECSFVSDDDYFYDEYEDYGEFEEYAETRVIAD